MVECKEMRSAINKGIQQAKYGPGSTVLLFSKHRNCTSHSSHLETYRARRDKDPFQNVTPVSLVVCSGTQVPCGDCPGNCRARQQGRRSLHYVMPRAGTHYCNVQCVNSNSPIVLRPNAGHGLLIIDFARSHTTTHHSR